MTTFVEEILLSLVVKTMNIYVQHALAYSLSITCTFDLCMSNEAQDVFVIIIIFQMTRRQSMSPLGCLK
jgi:hypothetical protein